MIISLANSIRFIKIDSLDPSLDNTLFADEDFYTYKSKGGYCQFWDADKSTIPVQIRTTLTETIILTRVNLDITRSVITPTTTTTYTDFKTIDYDISVNSGDLFYLIAESDDVDQVDYQSEPVSVEARGMELKIEWYSNDSDSVFQYDYTNDQVCRAYIRGETRKLSFKGDATVYDNQNEIVKVKQGLYRQFTLGTGAIPVYLSEKLQIAMAMDIFVVNDVGYTVEEIAESEPFGSTNLVTLTATLTQTNVLGMNTDDIGFDCDSNSDNMIENKVVANATADGTFSVTADFNVTQIIAIRNSGSSADATLKLGTSLGGEQIMYETAVPASGGVPMIDGRIYEPSITGAWTIYYTIGGATPDIEIRIQTIKNAQ